MTDTDFVLEEGRIVHRPTGLTLSIAESGEVVANDLEGSATIAGVDVKSIVANAQHLVDRDRRPCF